jgi:hypothetical protein
MDIMAGIVETRIVDREEPRGVKWSSLRAARTLERCGWPILLLSFVGSSKSIDNLNGCFLAQVSITDFKAENEQKTRL